MKNKMKTLAAVLAAIFVMAAGACWWGAAEAGTELRVALQSFDDGSPGINTHHTPNAQAAMLTSFHECLIERDPYARPLKFLPGLATSWKMISPTVMEMKLRKGVKFHDGSTLEAKDVEFTLNRIWKRTRPEFSGVQGRFFYNFDRVEVMDPLTIRIHTKRPEPLIEVLLSARNASITSKEYNEKVGFEKADLFPVGAGPYKVVSFRPRQELVLERFNDYYGEKAPLDRIVFKMIPEISSRITALVNKEVDFITNIPPDQVAPLQNRKDVKLVGVAWPMFHVYVLNMSHPVTGNKKLRQAMTLSIDRAALVQGLWQGKGLVPKAHQFKEYGEPLFMPDLEVITYDPAKARQLVKEAGYDGTPVLLTLNPHYYTYGDHAAQAIAEMWQKVGINVKIQMIDSFPSDLQKGGIMIRPWSNPMYYPDPMGAFDTHWSKAGWPFRQKMFVPQDPRWDGLYEKARFSTNAQERREAYAELNRIAQEEVPYILLYQPYESYAMRSDIEWRVPTSYRPYDLTFRAGHIKLGK